jgi:hypothetical protein
MRVSIAAGRVVDQVRVAFDAALVVSPYEFSSAGGGVRTAPASARQRNGGVHDP